MFSSFPPRRHIEDAKELLLAIKAEGLTGIRWAAYIRADNLDPELVQFMVETVMSWSAICAWATTFALFWRVAGC